MDRKPWHGVVVATALPFRDDLSVDFDAFAEHVAWLAANGCDGVAPNGSLGEYQTLTPDERRRVVEVAIDAAPAGFTVMPGVGAYGALESRRLAEHAAEAGAAGVMALPPNAYRADERAVVQHYREIAKAGLPISAYNNPIDTKVDLTPQLLATLYHEGLIQAVKEFSGDVRRIYEIAELAPGLEPVIGTDDTVLEVALAGATGWVAGYPNAFPRTCVELYRACISGRTGRRDAALPLDAPVAAVGLQDRVHPGDQAVDGPDRPARRAVPAAPPAAPAGTGGIGARIDHPGRRARVGLTPCAPAGSSTLSTRTPRACPPG